MQSIDSLSRMHSIIVCRRRHCLRPPCAPQTFPSPPPLPPAFSFRFFFHVGSFAFRESLATHEQSSCTLRCPLLVQGRRAHRRHSPHLPFQPARPLHLHRQARAHRLHSVFPGPATARVLRARPSLLEDSSALGGRGSGSRHGIAAAPSVAVEGSVEDAEANISSISQFVSIC